jgi:acetyl-CoA synthetase
MAIGDARWLVTDPEQHRRKIAPMRDRFPRLEGVLLTGAGHQQPGTTSLDEALAAAAPDYDIGPTDTDEPAILHFTSGTTGTPKGAVHVHGAVVTHHATGRLVLGLGEGDVYWCTADPGWVTGMSYGVIAPLTCGVTNVVDEADFDAERWYRVLAEQRVNVWYTSPTAIRMLMRAGPAAVAGSDLSAVRFAASVGEPLGADAVEWGRAVLGFPFNDNWWQTETGGIMIANRRGMPIRPGSMGRPSPGIEVEVFTCDDEGRVQTTSAGAPIPVRGPDASGMLAIRAPWPSMFRAYLGQPEHYERAFLAGWYLTGDLVRRDADGYLWFVSRADDVIKTSGHLIGPFEVETVLRAHPAVADAGVYGVPDPVAGALVHAAVVLAPGVAPGPETVRSVRGPGRRGLGAAVAPRRIVVVAALPKTRSGKVMRRLLRARELGLPEGDLSTLEPSHG